MAQREDRQEKLTMVVGDPTSSGPLRDTIRDCLRDQIIDGTYRPGDRIIERDVAAQFSVSRLPVREALRMLNTEGFVEMLPTRGVIVRQLSRKDIAEIFDVREALEGMAFRRASEHLTKRDGARLTALANRARRASDAGDSASLHALNEQFHDTINVLARNDLLVGLLEPLSGRLHWVMRQNDDPQRVWLEHEELFDAVIAKQSGLAERLAIDHVRLNRARVFEYLFGRSAGQHTAG